MPGGIYTLADYAQALKDDVERQMLSDLLEGEDWLPRMPVREVRGLQAAVRIMTDIPVVGERRINEPFPNITMGHRRIQTFTLTVIGGVLPLDVLYRQLPEEALAFDPVQEDLSALQRSMRWKVRDLVFNGSVVANERVFDGIKQWANDPANSAMVIDAGGLDISPSASALETNLKRLMDYLDDAIDRCDGHEADVIFTSRAGFLRLQAVPRIMPGLFPFGENKMELKVASYHGMPILQAGYRPGAKALSDEQIIKDSGESGANTGTDIYVVKFAQPGMHGVRLLSWGGPKLEDIGRDTSDPATYKWLVSWAVGLEIAGVRPVARIKNVKVV